MHIQLLALTHYLREGVVSEDVAIEGGATFSAEALLEHAGRVCYRSDQRRRSDTATFLRARLREGHESIIEHASATFEVSGISRACSHQLVRHRLASYSQESQRYVDQSDPEMVIPPSVAGNPEAVAVWERMRANVIAAYSDLRELGIPKEDARFVLPNATATRIVVTMNFREYLHFFRMRITPQAQWEIRQMALRMLQVLAEHVPIIFGDFLAQVREQYPGYVTE